MNNEKILGLSNTEDVMWFKISPSDTTLKIIDSIFDIYDNLYEDDAKDIHSYEFHMESGEMSFNKETDEFVAYFIFTKTTVHVILRKTLNWENYSNKIKDSFKFI